MTNPLTPTFSLRRDFADELGFGEFLMAHATAPLPGELTCLNASRALSPALPRFVGYYTSAGIGCITADATLVFKSKTSGLFRTMLDKLQKGIADDPLLSAADAASPGRLSIDADDDGIPPHVVVHDTHSAGAYLMTFEQAADLLATQP